MPLRLAEAQTLHEALNDALFSPSLRAFFSEQLEENTKLLLSAVRQHLRDTMKEARLAGKAEAYEEAFEELRRFAKEQLKQSTQ